MGKVIRYLVSLLWSWVLPFMAGATYGTLLCAWQLQELSPLLTDTFGEAIADTVSQCMTGEVPHG